jgi:hypothetical protein
MVNGFLYALIEQSFAQTLTPQMSLEEFDQDVILPHPDVSSNNASFELGSWLRRYCYPPVPNLRTLCQSIIQQRSTLDQRLRLQSAILNPSIPNTQPPRAEEGPGNPEPATCSTTSPMDYLPMPTDPVKVVTLHFAFPQQNSPLGPGNFARDHDGMGNRNYNGSKCVQHLIQSINELAYRTIPPTWCGGAPCATGNPFNYQARPMHIKFVAGSITYPRVGVDFGSLNSSFTTTGTWGMYPRIHGTSGFHQYERLVRPNGLNVYLTTSQYGPTQVGRFRSTQTVMGRYDAEWFPHFSIGGLGYAIGIGVASAAFTEVASQWQSVIMRQRYWPNSDGSIYQGEDFCRDLSYTTSHEIMHLLGLGHSHESSGHVTLKPTPNTSQSITCTDFARTTTSSWCGPGSQNNLMGYSCDRGSLSPCQLSGVHFNLQNGLGSHRYLPCESDARFPTLIPQNTQVVWNTRHDLAGDLILKSGSRLEIRCGVTMAHGARIIVPAGAQIVGRDRIQRRALCKTDSPNSVMTEE